MLKLYWKCYMREQPLLVLVNQPEVYILLKRFPSPGEHFRWNNARWRVRDIDYAIEHDAFGDSKKIEAVVDTNLPGGEFHECPECGGIIRCSDTCKTGLHRDALFQSRSRRTKKSRSGTLDAPLRDIISRRGNTEKLECGHWVHYKEFKWVDKTATARRCLVCCLTCPARPVKRRCIRAPG